LSLPEVTSNPTNISCSLHASWRIYKKWLTLSNKRNNKDFKLMKKNELSSEEEQVIVHKGTERPFTGKYTDHSGNGIYLCKQCDNPLYRSESKFQSSCGWPSFDNEIAGAVKRLPDADGRRVEILCMKCDGHLGHVFEGEGLTAQNIRHCVNSISMNFVEGDQLERAIFASGCFWGTEYFLQKEEGVLATTCGYIGGGNIKPVYKDVCSGTTGHAEAVEVLFDPKKTSFRELAKIFFETHDPTQVDRQGPDIGTQYRSEIFFLSESQEAVAQELIAELEGKGYKVATKLTAAPEFWDAEVYHQDYYDNKGAQPYCHIYQKKFD
jgi:peptide methionine sulfoxide reductase msrA/msrB